MNYIEKIEEAIAVCNSMPRVLTTEQLKEVEKQYEDNNVLKYLLGILKDSRVYGKDGIALRQPTEQNDGNTRLQNYVNFKKGMAMLKEDDAKYICYILRHTDEEEQKMYLSILQKTIVVKEPKTAEEPKVSPKQEPVKQSESVSKPKPKPKQKKNNKAKKPAK